MTIMNDSHIIATIVEDSWLTLEQLAHICDVNQDWLKDHLEAGLFPYASCFAGTWRLTNHCVLRARRMYRLEQDFEAVPELAALMADMQDELAALRAQLHSSTFRIQR